MIANINPDTGIAYGYISANALDSELVTELMNCGNNLTASEAYSAWEKEKIAHLQVNNPKMSDTEAKEETGLSSHEFWETYEDYEPTIEGTKDGVNYRTSWIGGALNFFIFSSPHITQNARLASPCVPNAGILDTLDGGITSYNVPDDWRRVED
jgi:hypothetical protein